MAGGVRKPGNGMPPLLRRARARRGEGMGASEVGPRSDGPVVLSDQDQVIDHLFIFNFSYEV